jgi:hypothetical protein
VEEPKVVVVVGAQWGDEGKVEALGGRERSGVPDARFFALGCKREPAAEILSEAKEP